jgi:hypothetical protein
LPLLLLVLFHPNQRTVISTEAARTLRAARWRNPFLYLDSVPATTFALAVALFLYRKLTGAPFIAPFYDGWDVNRSPSFFAVAFSFACHSERSEEPPHLAFAVVLAFPVVLALVLVLSSAVASLVVIPEGGSALASRYPRLQPWVLSVRSRKWASVVLKKQLF